MELSKNLRKVLVAGAALLMAASVMGTGNVVNAKHRRYHYRTHRVYRRHARRHYRKVHKHYRRRVHVRRHRSHGEYAWMADGGPHNSVAYYKVKIIGYTKRDDEPHVRYLSKNQIKFDKSKTGYVPVYGLFHTRAEAVRNETDTNPNVVDVSYHNGSLEDMGKKIHHRKSHRSKSHKHSHVNNVTQAQKETIKDINRDREANGVQPIQESQGLDEIAKIRAEQSSQNFTHTDPNTGQDYWIEDAEKAGITPHSHTGENLDASDMNVKEIRSDGSSYYSHNGKELADNDNNGLMNHDTSSNPATNWGHRNNILNSDWNYAGVGVTKTPHKSYDSYTIAEEFSN